MKKNGFTLIELITTIALITIVATVFTVNMVSLKNKQDQKEETRLQSAIKSAAETYFNVDSEVSSNCVSVAYLIENNYLQESVITNEVYNGYSIKADSGKYSIYNEDNCTGDVVG